MPTYKAIKLDYSGGPEGAKTGGLFSSHQHADLSKVNQLAEAGWELFEVSHDESGCFQEAIMVKRDA